MKPIEIEIKYEIKDLWRYYLQYFFSAANIFYGFFGYLIFGIFLTLLLSRNPSDKIFLYIGLLSLLFTFLSLFVQFYYSLNPQKTFDKNFKCIFSEKNVEFIMETSYSRSDWQHFASVKETNSDFRLCGQDNFPTLIPKRFLQLEEIAQLKELLKEKLGDRAMLKEAKNKLGLK